MLLLFKNLVFTLLVPGTVGVVIPLTTFSHNDITPMSIGLGALLLVFGTSVYLWCLWDFGTTGRGTPAPIDAPKQLVVRGLYRYSRNPMYTGVLAVILGFSVLFRSTTIAIYGVCVAAAFSLIVLFYEEPHLKRIFGSSYETYCSEVSRWIPIRKPRTVA